MEKEREKETAKITVDGNYATSLMMHKITEFASIYPITPSSPMAENYEQLTASGAMNLFGDVPKVVQMQSEAGVAGALHGAILSGAVSTTFTSSQGLLLMVPNMYKIAGELLPCVINVSARSLATHALNIFGDHSDVMATRETGFAMLCASNVQECYDFALLSLVSTFNSSVPFLHFFDGFRTSHEIAKMETLTDEQINYILPLEKIAKFKANALSPTSPIAVGTNQNADVFFQNREANQKYYQNVALTVQNAFDAFYKLSGRRYNLFDYVGNPNPKYVIVAMGSGAENIEEFLTQNAFNADKESCGFNFNDFALIKIRLFRPFDLTAFASTLPTSVERICVLDRIKDSTANVDPLASEVINALQLTNRVGIDVVAGRYGLGGKDFTIGMIKAVCENLASKTPKKHFCVGINDDVTNLSLNFTQILERGNYCALFYGLGSDGTVSANKNSIKIIGDNTNKYVQGYFEYDSKKSGSMTVSHLRVSENKIFSHYLINNADLIAVHNFNFLIKIKITNKIKCGGALLLNAPYDAEELIKRLPKDLANAIVEKGLNVYYINANKIAFELGLKNKINIIMQACFFKISNQIDEELAKSEMIKAIKQTYGSKGEQIVNANISAVNVGFDCLKTLKFEDVKEYINNHPHFGASAECCTTNGADSCVGGCTSNETWYCIESCLAKGAMGCTSNSEESCATNCTTSSAECCSKATACECGASGERYAEEFIKPILCGRGDELPVSAFDKSGAMRTGTSKLEKRKIADKLPKWIAENCIQCNMCALSCPHACIRPKIMAKDTLKSGENGTKDEFYNLNAEISAKNAGLGCKNGEKAQSKEYKMCGKNVEKGDNFQTATFMRDKEYEYRMQIKPFDCTGCGVCASVCPAKKKALEMVDADSIFEDEVKNDRYVQSLPTLKNNLSKFTIAGSQFEPTYFEFSGACAGCGETPYIKLLTQLFGRNLIIANATGCSSIYGGSCPTCPYTTDSDGCGPVFANSLFEDNAEFGLGLYLGNRIRGKGDSVWIVGGDGWAYDIGFGGLDHVLSSGENINILVLDTEVYSNTGGQASKSTPRGSYAKFSSGGKMRAKKRLSSIALCYGDVYVAQIALGANMRQAINAFKEASEYNGVSLIIAYCPCINHGIDMSKSSEEMKLAVQTGYFDLFRYNPNNTQNPLSIDSVVTKDYSELTQNENRYKILKRKNSELSDAEIAKAKADAERFRKFLKSLQESLKQ